MSILKLLKEVLVGKDVPEGAIITDKPITGSFKLAKTSKDKLDKIRADIEKTKIYVPWQIWADHNHNNQRENDMEPPTSWAVSDNRLYTVYPCGCKFEEGLKKYSFSGSWCGEHCKKFIIRFS